MLIEAKDTNNTPEIYDDFYLDWYEFNYWHTFRAEYNRLAFNSTTDPEVSGKTQFVVTNFSTDAIDVYTMSSRGLTEKLVDGRVSSDGNSYQIQFEDDVTQYTITLSLATDTIGVLVRLLKFPQVLYEVPRRRQITL